VDLAAVRARREAFKQQRRRQQAGDNFSVTAPDCGRDIPPRTNPDVPDMVDQVKECCVDLTGWITAFQHEMTELGDAGRLDPGESTGLLEHYDQLQEAVDAATTHAVRWPTGSGVTVADFVNDLADHAKYVYAVGSRDIAALQYRLAELAHTGRLDFEAHKRLQWDDHCLGMWELLCGTLYAVRDERNWHGDWSDDTYSDGRQVMMQARVKGWEILERDWPYNEGMSADGAINEHPLGSVCRIAPVHNSEKERDEWHQPLEIDLKELLGRMSAVRPDR
jgi:hypothetical protein